jgi:hypothetical protein
MIEQFSGKSLASEIRMRTEMVDMQFIKNYPGKNKGQQVAAVRFIDSKVKRIYIRQFRYEQAVGPWRFLAHALDIFDFRKTGVIDGSDQKFLGKCLHKITLWQRPFLRGLGGSAGSLY